MDMRALDEHTWRALVSDAGDQAGATTGAERDVAGFQVLSLEQYAASHVRSAHQH